jgi:replicative DNA helicase
MAEVLNLGELEYLILNYATKDRSFWLKVFESLKPAFFEKEDNKKIFTFFKKYFGKYNQLPDYQVAANELRDVEQDNLTAVFGEEKPETKEYIYDSTLTFIKESMMREALLKSIDLLEKRKFEEIESAIKHVIKFNLDASLGVKLTDIDGRYEKIKKLEVERIPTGMPQLDAILNGGWGRKELYACAAPPGIGKSIFLANWACHAVRLGKNAVVYTLEISEERLSMRHDSILTRIPTNELLFDIDKIKEKYRLLALTTKANMWIKEFPTKGASINQLKSHHEQLMLYEDFRPEVIFVDYAGLMRPSYRVGDNYEDLRAIFEDLRGWAVEMDIPIITAAQTNRKSLDEKGGTKEVITMAQVADSLGITQTLDCFMTITQSRTEKEEGIINLYIDKHRHGESSKSIKFSLDYKNFILEEYAI